MSVGNPGDEADPSLRAGAAVRPRARPTQADRSARSRRALLESAARGLSRYGYGNLALADVAAQAGYTRGALYHQFKDKSDLVLAVIESTFRTWRDEVGFDVPAELRPDPLAALLALARDHAVFCRRDVARLVMALRLEFSGQDHPVGRAIEDVYGTIVARCAELVDAARRLGSLPPGPPTPALALAFVGAVEGAVIAVAGQAPHDEVLAVRTAAGVLGLPAVPG
jgi:AcrR family transcriptional regulator